MQDTELFFIAGCQRSGTTLMRLILESHSKIRCFDEEEGYRILVDPRFRDALQVSGAGWVGFKIPRFSEQLLLGSMRDVDYGTFPSFYRREPIIFMVRDCGDVVRSMDRLAYPDGETWLKKYGKKILMSKAEDADFSEENRVALRVIEREGYPEHLVGALYWKYKTEALFELIRSGVQVQAICYEYLVSNPKEQLAEVVAIFGLLWEDALLNHHRLEHEEVDERGLAIGGTNPRLAIHANSVRKHHEYFSPLQKQEMRDLISGTLEKLAAIGIVYD